jgi:hypothetical protein
VVIVLGTDQCALREAVAGAGGHPNTNLVRKSVRMHRDFEAAAIVVAALRPALARLKAGQNPASAKHLENSYCNADWVDPTVLSPAQLAAY